MRITVCELDHDLALLSRQWSLLIAHAKQNKSELVLLPEMPFAPWFGSHREFAPSIWEKAVQLHRDAVRKLADLAPAVVFATRPVTLENQRLNEGFLWEPPNETTPVHYKYYLPDEEGVWERHWYERGLDQFSIVSAAGAKIGFLICSELWYPERARSYGEQGAHLILTPRKTERASLDKWLIAARAASLVSGAYSLSSNTVTEDGTFGGHGWIIDPRGEILGLTSPKEPFLTLEIDLCAADRAKEKYPHKI